MARRSRDGGIEALSHNADGTIPQAASRPAPLEGESGGPMTSIGPYRKDVEDLGPEGVNMEDGEKALRKLQHSCNF